MVSSVKPLVLTVMNAGDKVFDKVDWSEQKENY